MTAPRRLTTEHYYRVNHELGRAVELDTRFLIEPLKYSESDGDQAEQYLVQARNFFDQLYPEAKTDDDRFVSSALDGLAYVLHPEIYDAKLALGLS